MKCRFCDAEMETGTTCCPACGKEVEEEMTPVEAACEASDGGNGECACEHSCACTDETSGACAEQNEETVASKKPAGKFVLKGWKLWTVIAGGVVLLLALVGVVARYGLGINLLPKENNVFNKNSYTVGETVMNIRKNAVIATLGDKTLTNKQLQLYYCMQVLEFQKNYGESFDFSIPLDEQKVGDRTLQQYFLQYALETWQQYETWALLAQESGYELSEETQEYLADLPEQLKELAGTDYESVDDMLEDVFCPGVTLEEYMAYMETYSLSYEYVNTLYASVEPTQEELETYFTEHEDALKESGVTKESGMIADVRHILIVPEGGTKGENNQMTYTEDEMAACLEKAEALLEQWKNGEATEESFAELAKEHSEDGGSKANGGLYENITPSTKFVPNFLNWTVDENRKVGDTGIVESTYGYHIMYYVGGEPIWLYMVRNNYAGEQMDKMIASAMERWPMEVKYNKIVLNAEV